MVTTKIVVNGVFMLATMASTIALIAVISDELADGRAQVLEER